MEKKNLLGTALYNTILCPAFSLSKIWHFIAMDTFWLGICFFMSLYNNNHHLNEIIPVRFWLLP